jgi:hypothetical protein
MKAPVEGDTKPCPTCGGIAVFSTRMAVIERDGRMYKDRAPGSASNYAKGWSCSRGSCDFSEALPMEVPS